MNKSATAETGTLLFQTAWSAGGVGDRLLIPETGLYLLLLTASTLSSSGHAAVVDANGTTVLAAAAGPASAGAARHTASTLAFLNEGTGGTRA
ncbi:hypothetical protein [Rhizobium sp. CF122]|uniref:hypothetical protein n=1 Tax=Rhizobium sp. CF122 TaxID=1144312 RepID=UPI0012FB5BCF|nr:hypothetical protein [Rhizobium sp. CF122]